MIDRLALEKYTRAHHGIKTQALVLSFITAQVDELEAFGFSDISMHEIYKQCNKVYPFVSISTMNRWWKLYLEWGELPDIVKEKKKKMKNKMLMMGSKAAIDDNELMILKYLVDEDPNLYLDEIALRFAIKTGKYLCHNTIWRYLHDRLGYSLRVLSDVAKQRSIDDEERFLAGLDGLLQGCPERLVMVDETHKDRNAARRRRGWKKRNSNAETNEWYQNCVCYTMMGAADINGFIPFCCHLVERKETSDEGAAGTVDAGYFLWWVENFLCPKLGNYNKGEPRSVVFMDNASTHMTAEVEMAIAATGAVMIYGAPYLPHLNPIENYFSLYKAYLKRNSNRMHDDWIQVHIEALQTVDRDTGIKYFRRCRIPGSRTIFTEDEFIEYVKQQYQIV